MHTSKIGVVLPGYKCGPATSCSNSASRKKTWTWHKFQKQWRQQKIWLNLGAVKVRKNSCRAANNFFLLKVHGHTILVRQKIVVGHHKKLTFTRKIVIHPYCKKENKNKLSDIMSDHSLDFVQGHEQILAYVDERLLFTAVITRIVNWLALIKFLEPTSLHLWCIQTNQLSSAFNSYPGWKYMYYAVGKFFIAEKVC